VSYDSPAVQRAVEMMHVPMGELPQPALLYAAFLCQKFMMCGEVCLSAYATYAQIVEGLACDDSLYVVTDEHRAWWAEAQRDFEQVPDPNGKIRIRRRAA
jgi:hypothetical protein